MTRICAWCGEPKSGDQQDSVLGVTHGICKPCAAKVEADARESHKRITARVDVVSPRRITLADLDTKMRKYADGKGASCEAWWDYVQTYTKLREYWLAVAEERSPYYDAATGKAVRS